MTELTLDIRKASVQFGGLKAVSEVNIQLAKGEFVGLIGPNGAGKTTIFNLITGAVPPSEGQVLFNGASIVGKPVDALCHLGISRTFQNIRLFPRMTAFENVALGFHARPTYTVWEAFVRTKRARQQEKKIEEQVMGLLAEVGLEEHAQAASGSLPYGLQRRLELARAMATQPELLLLDEPAAGMNEDECDELVQIIETIHAKWGYTIFLIEHHMNVVMELCRNSRLYVLDLGQILAQGTPQEIQNNPDVIRAYLGE